MKHLSLSGYPLNNNPIFWQYNFHTFVLNVFFLKKFCPIGPMSDICCLSYSKEVFLCVLIQFLLLLVLAPCFNHFVSAFASCSRVSVWFLHFPFTQETSSKYPPAFILLIILLSIALVELFDAGWRRFISFLMSCSLAELKIIILGLIAHFLDFLNPAIRE